MASESDLQSAKRRTDEQARTPVEGFSLEPLPPEIIKAFPKMDEWQKRCNARIAEWNRKLNTVQSQVT